MDYGALAQIHIGTNNKNNKQPGARKYRGGTRKHEKRKKKERTK